MGEKDCKLPWVGNIQIKKIFNNPWINIIVKTYFRLQLVYSTWCQNLGNDYLPTSLHICCSIITLQKAHSQSVEMTHFLKSQYTRYVFLFNFIAYTSIIKPLAEQALV